MKDKKAETDACFHLIYEQTRAQVWQYILCRCRSSEDCQDLLQDVYVQLYYVLRTKGTDYIRDPRAFTLRLASDRIARYYEKLPRRPTPFTALTEEDGDIVSLIAAEENVENEAITLATVSEIREKLRGRDFETRRIFYLYYTCGLTLAQIAALTGEKESSVKTKLYRTLKVLRKAYRKGDDES